MTAWASARLLTPPAAGVLAAAQAEIPWTAIAGVVGVVAAAYITNVVGQRVAGSSGRSASAQEVTAMGARLDAQGKQLTDKDELVEQLRGEVRELRDYIYDVVRAARNGDPIPTPRDGLL